jgi:hypothetical protein
MTAARDPDLKKWRRFKSGPEGDSSLMWNLTMLPGYIMNAKGPISNSLENAPTVWLQAREN